MKSSQRSNKQSAAARKKNSSRGTHRMSKKAIANYFKREKQKKDIDFLWGLGWQFQEIADHLGIKRGVVRKTIRGHYG